MKFLIKFSYDGSNYCGFQIQKDRRSIQEELENALTKVNDGKKTAICASGRTDKGVHALCQYGHSTIDIDITESKLKRALNSNLPEDIHVIDVKKVDKNFHARYNVKKKEYIYKINIGEYNPIERNYIFQYNHNLDIEKMKKSIKTFEGEHDFRAFVTENKDKENCIRTIYKTSIIKTNDIIEIKFIGNGFLRYQVRNMVGILIRVGEGKLDEVDIKKILDSKDRSKTGKTAPAEGLYLSNIEY